MKKKKKKSIKNKLGIGRLTTPPHKVEQGKNVYTRKRKHKKQEEISE